MDDSLRTDVEIRNAGQSVSRIILDPSVRFDRLFPLLDAYGRIYIVADRNVVRSAALLNGVPLPGDVSLMNDVPLPGDVSLLKDNSLLNSVPLLAIEADEDRKTMDAVLEICEWLLCQGADRDALVLGVGGGVVLDVAGFAASIYKRGVRFANVPTTLLSQVDAGIGGKTGVNFNRYKNILGVIRQPEFTYLNVNMLASLSRRDFLSGAAEMLKTFIIEDNGNYIRAVGFISRYAALQSENSGCILTDEMADELLYLVREAVRVKAGIVSRDTFESGERRKLNLGHTFAHAIETLCRRASDCGADAVKSECCADAVKSECCAYAVKSDSCADSAKYDITHGEAVAVGMVMAARLAERLSETGAVQSVEKGLSGRLKSDLLSCGLPVECPFTIREMAAVMSKDKKAEGPVVHFVLPLSIGDVVVEDLSVSDVEQLLS